MTEKQDNRPFRIAVSQEILNRRGFLKVTGLGIAGMTVLSSCGKAQVEPIRFINYVDWIGEGEYDSFQEKTEIEVQEVVINQDSERIAKLAADPNAADMILLTYPGLARLDYLGILAELDMGNIPNYSLVDPNFKVGLVSDETGKGIASDYGRVGFAYRTDLVDEELKTWADVWRVAPEYSGKITFLDFHDNTLMTTLLMLGYDGNSRDEGELQDAADALIEIKPHLQAVVSTDMLKPLLDGSGVIGMTWDFDASLIIRDNPNVPIKWVDAEDGMYGYLDVWGAINTSKVINEVEQFMNHHLEPEVYANFCNTLYIASIIPSADRYISEDVKNDPVTYPPPEVSALITFADDLGEANEIWLDAWAQFKAA